MNTNLNDILNVACATKNLRHQTIGTVVTNMTKAYKLTPEDADLLEKAMIEIAIGISSLGLPSHQTLTVRKALEYYAEACASTSGRCTLLGSDECSSKNAKEALEDFICFYQN